MNLIFFIFFLLSNSLWAQSKAALCSACHGAQGISANPKWPHLAGQHRTYLAKQLLDMKTGTTRTNPEMSRVLSTLTTHDIEELANYYASMPRARETKATSNTQLGEYIYRHGNTKKHIIACIICHGPQGLGGANSGFPVLAGQHIIYTVTQLNAFKNKQRTNDRQQVMHQISEQMSDEELLAVAQYIASMD